MGEDDVGLQVVHQQLGILEAVLGNGVHQIVHIVGLQQQVHQGILKAHQVVALLEDAGAHKAHGQVLVVVDGGGGGDGLLPAVGAVGHQVRHLDRIPPAGDIRADLIIVGHMGHRAGSVLGEQDLGAPLVIAGHAALAVAAGILLQRIVHHRYKGLVLAQQPLGLTVALEGFQ